ncbi:hypothetical protein H310_15339 [Aphanomyces invadans]|uniref:AMP-dependent synthetase/ligase domain-containing protein n=1 Tax=Aphanomyces invadans TaxID=157072 RepID=A0A024T7L5_9STRA|nr:hypothetical protein H310_15339 [Aphanomyces invadans]ETV89824.1 hypothetical protein H310_15339 [Aphanomyces invadans]|eukprot:XP_008881544.1 hypothetical protein H310_15339 [Aphanomyces invadans]
MGAIVGGCIPAGVYTASNTPTGAGVDDAVLEARMDAQKPGNCCTLFYTSGTTGNPKAAVEATAVHYERTGIVLNEHGNTVSYLSLSHVAAQLFDMYLPLARGMAIYFAQPDALKGGLGTTLKEARPTLFFAVPRVWEKMMEKMISIGRGTTGLKKRLVTWAKSVGAAKHDAASTAKAAAPHKGTPLHTTWCCPRFAGRSGSIGAKACCRQRHRSEWKP